MTENKRELDLIYQTYKGLTLSELEDAFSNAETQEKIDFFLKLYNLKLAEYQQKHGQVVSFVQSQQMRSFRNMQNIPG